LKLRHVAQSLVFRLILIGVFLVIVGSAARSYIMSSFLREDIAAVVAEQQTALANYVARDIGHQIFLRKSRLQQLADSLPAPMTGEGGGMDPSFGTSSPFEALFSGGLLLTNRQGRVILDTTRFEWSSPAADFVRHIAATGDGADGVLISTPIKVAGDGVAVLPMTIALSVSGQAPWGHLTGFTYLYSPSFLGNLLQARLGQTGSGFLLISPKDRLFVAASNPGKVLTSTPDKGINLLHDRAMEGYRGVGVTRNAQGVEEISAMVSVPNTDWFLVSAIATSEALGTVDRVKAYLFQNTVVTISLMVIILAIWITFLLRPLTVATSKADQMSKGQAPLSPLPGAGKGEIGVLIGAFNRLLTKLNEQQAELANAANHDPLTGLPNRRYFSGRLREALETVQRQRAIALLFLDLDQFKPINDQLGHEIGDSVLQIVAQRLGNQLRSSDLVARLGGDEFVILLSDLDESAAMSSVEEIADGLIRVVTMPFAIAGAQCRLGASIGGVISNGADSVADLMRWADQLMYLAKEGGGNASVIRHAHECEAMAA